MLAAGIAWIVTTPYLMGLAVANWRPLNRLVSRNLTLTTLVGWAAIFALVGAVFGAGGGPAALIAAPFVGLAFWTPGRRDDDDDGEPPIDEPKPPRPGMTLPQPRHRSRGGQPEPRVRPRTRKRVSVS